LQGTIPGEIGELTSLIQLGLDFNTLSGAIPPIKSANLQSLFLQQNQFAGTLEGLVNLTSLQYLYVSKNKISGTLPEKLGAINSLQQIGVDFNLLTGTIPPSFGLSQNFLQGFYAQNNSFTGRFPGNSLSKAQQCDCSGNRFSCPIPNPPLCRVSGCI